MDMKSDNMFEKFENLLSTKDFSDLNEDERSIACEFAGSSSEYDAMRRVMLESNFLAKEIARQEAPSGGADQVWSRFEANIASKKRIYFFNRKISVYWVAGLAAALTVSWLIRFPFTHKDADPVYFQMNRPVLVQTSISDTIVKEVPVYIQSEPVVIVEKPGYAPPSGGMVYMQPVKSVNEQKEQRQGTNANEMGDLAKLTVAVQ